MNAIEFEKLGLNHNEAKVYLAILEKGRATAQELIKDLGVHRNIIYDNVERLIEKGLVSYIVNENKKLFIAEDPNTIIDYLNERKKELDTQIEEARELMPKIAKIMSTSKDVHEASLFRGIKGLKKLLNDVLRAEEVWVLGCSNDSVNVLGETYWKNWNLKLNENNIKEHMLINADFKDDFKLEKSKNITTKRLPSELNQNVEIILFQKQVAIFIYSQKPSATLINDEHLFNGYRKQFDFLWESSENKKTK